MGTEKEIGKTAIEERPEREQVRIASDSVAESLAEYIGQLSPAQVEILEIGLGGLNDMDKLSFTDLAAIPLIMLPSDRLKICKAYSSRKNGDYNAIMEDIKLSLDEISEDDFIEWLAKTDNIVLPPEYTENGKEELLIDINTETAVDWLNSKLEPFLYALMEWRLPTDEYETLVKGKIESWLGEEHTAEVKPVEAAEEKRTNRTRKAADDIVDKPKNLLEIITHPQYVNALGTEESGNAYLQLYRRDAIEDIIFDDGSIYFKSGNKRVLQAQLTDFRTKEGISDLDMPMLRVLYNFYLQGKRKNPEVKVVTAYIPDLYEYVTGEGKRNVPATVYLKDEAGNFVLDENGEKKIARKGFADYLLDLFRKNLHNAIGTIYTGRPDPSQYPVITFQGYNAELNTISFSSPYFEKLIGTMEENRLEYTHKTNGRQFKLGKPVHSLMIHSDIVSERNKIAIRNTEIIVTVIEQAGESVKNPHIRIATIIERNELLAEKLASSKNISRDLDRAFRKTYELLRTHTRLQEKYKDIQLPSEADIPKARDYRSKVLTFNHKGLNKNFIEEEQEKPLTAREKIQALNSVESAEDKRRVLTEIIEKGNREGE